MDELKIETTFTRRLIAKLLAKSIKKRYGYDISINLDSFSVTVVGDVAHVSLSADADIPTKEITKIMEV